jgi:two-component system, OmpR family, alkaline phosphatase synthesis response regulator PhoP
MATEKILVADDEVQYVDVISYKFRNAGFEVITAANGREALELVKKECPDLVIMDYQMPEMDGLELCMEIRKDPKLSHTPVILLTAYGMIIDEQEQKKAKISVLMPKPFSPRELLAKARELLNQTCITVDKEERGLI